MRRHGVGGEAVAAHGWIHATPKAAVQAAIRPAGRQPVTGRHGGSFGRPFIGLVRRSGFPIAAAAVGRNGVPTGEIAEQT